jgi:hypothetical protein
MRTTILSVENVIVSYFACITIELVCIRPVPELHRIKTRLSTVTTNELLTLWTPIEPAEVMFLSTSRTFESRMPTTAKDIVLKGIASFSDWILFFFLNLVYLLAIVTGLRICGLVETHENSKKPILLNSSPEHLLGS